MRNNKLIESDIEFYKKPSQIDYLFLGHSKPFAAIDVSQFKNGVQFCAGGESNIQTYYKLKHLLENSDKQLKYIVLPYGFASFNSNKTQLSTNSFYWKKYVDYIDVGRNSDKFWNYVSVDVKSRVCPYYEYPFLRLSLYYGELNIVNSKEDYSSLTKLEKQSLSNRIITTQMENRDLYSDVSFIYLQKTIDLATKYDKKIIYVKYPVSQSYYVVKNDMTEENSIPVQKFVDQVNIPNENIQVLDLESVYFDTDELFKDPQHLKPQGREKFTSLLLDKISSLQL